MAAAPVPTGPYDPIAPDAARSELLERAHRARREAWLRLLQDENAVPFWDVVVLTAADEAQAAVFEQQLDDQRGSGRLPARCEYLVVADPPGPKIGNGGATLVALDMLEERIGARLDELRVLLIHTGGFSKRLPHVSAGGKVFAALPIDGALHDMLYAKLVMYIHLPARMRAGVFITCADDIEVFDSQDPACDFDLPGITALAHPSPLTVGETHGVFVLSIEDRDRACLAAQEPLATQRAHACVVDRFLHKPSQPEMHEHGAVIAPLGATPFVYTDSAYFMDRDTAKLLLGFYRAHRPLQCEVDAYGDFLQALGPSATPAYTHTSANVVTATPSLTATRRSLFDALRAVPLHAIVLNASVFYHLGTFAEYLRHLTADTAFRRELAIAPRTAVAGAAIDASPAAVLMAVRAAGPAVVDSTTVVEYTHLGRCRVGAGSVLSHAEAPDGAQLPPNSFVYVLPVVYQRLRGYVAIALGTDDDVKRRFKAAGDATLAGRRLSELLGVDPAALWPASVELTLWEAALFPIHPSRAAATAWAVAFLQAARTGASLPVAADGPRLSLAAALACQDRERIRADRQQLLAAIEAAGAMSAA